MRECEQAVVYDLCGAIYILINTDYINNIFLNIRFAARPRALYILTTLSNYEERICLRLAHTLLHFGACKQDTNRPILSLYMGNFRSIYQRNKYTKIAFIYIRLGLAPQEIMECHFLFFETGFEHRVLDKSNGEAVGPEY